MSFDFGPAVIDNEIAPMIKRVGEGLGFSEDSVSLEEIEATGPAGEFAANPETLQRMKTATFMPERADRKPREQWELEGASTIPQRATTSAAARRRANGPSVGPAIGDAAGRRRFPI
jgi:trimethylamine--corrinoid protein Co-methyltransferase